MADIFFFTDTDILAQQPQTIGQAYGPVVGDESTKFRVTDLHNVNSGTVRAIAVCDGIVAIQKNNDDPANLVNLILKPTKTFFELSGVNQVPVKYIIYKGLLKSSLITLDGSDEVIKNPSNELTSHLYEIQNKINREKEKISNPPATPNSINDKPSAKLIKYDVSLTSTDSVDKLFYEGNTVYQAPDVKGGWYIGDFNPNMFGLEILLDDVRSSILYSKIKNTETIIEVLPSTSNTQEEIFRKKTQKEEVLFYLDPCAFYGSFHKIFKIKYVDSSIAITPGSATAFLEITSSDDLFNTLLSKFKNQNKVYIDIRNEFNRSFNYQENYSNTINLKVGADNTFNPIDYYNDAAYNQYWPILIVKDSFEYLPATNGENFNSIEIQLPYSKTENSKPILFISQGYTDRRFPTELKGRKKFISKKQGPTGFTKSLILGVPNVSGTNTTPSSCYIKIKYLKAKETQVSSGIVHRKETFFDNMFQPILFKTPINLPLPAKTFVTVYNTQEYIETDIGERFAASVGMARDIHNVTLFAFAQDLNKRSSSFIPVSLLSEASNKEYFMSHVNDKYVTQKLLEGVVDGANKYLRFEDTDRLFSRSFRNTDPKLDKHFLSIVLKSSTYDSLLINNGNILDEYDAYIVLKNGDTTHIDTVNGQKYTTYNLILRGYKNVSGNLSFEEFPGVADTQIVLYGYSDENTLILVEEGAATDLYTIDNTGVPCNSTSLSSGDKTILQSFLTELNSAAALTFRPNKDLSDNLFMPFTTPSSPHGFYLDGALNLVSPSFTPTNGFLAEGCYMLAMYKLTKVLDNIRINNQFSDQFYVKIKNSLVKNGFKEPENITEHQNYFDLLRTINYSIGINVNTSNNRWGFIDVVAGRNNLKYKLYQLMALGNWDGGNKLFTFPYTINSQKDNRVLAYLDNILVDISSTFYEELQKEATCLFNIFKSALSINVDEPKYSFLATGEGSQTNGLLNNSSSFGSILYSYGFAGDSNIKATNSKEFDSRKKTVKTTVHLSIIGLNVEEGYTSPQVNVYVNFLESKKEYKCSLTADQISNKKLYGISNSQVYITPTATGYDFKTVDSNVKIASFDFLKNDFTIEKIDEDFKLKIDLTSGNVGAFPDLQITNYDETQLMICLVDGVSINSTPFNLELEDVYDNNRFELTKAQKTDLFFQNGVFEGVTGLVDKLLEPGITLSNINLLLKGGNVGKRKPQEEQAYSTSDVERNLQFDFSLPKLNGRAAERPGELAGDNLVRYSHGFVFVEDTEITIIMESYVSPRWARLDEALYNDATNTTIDKDTLIADLDLYTLFGAVQAGNITLPTGINPYVFAPKYDGSSPTAIQIPSYNPVLSALRCFGLLDGLRSLVRKRASDMGKTAAEINTITQKLDDAIDLTSISQDLNIGIAKPISKLDFDKFKWYTNGTDKAQFGDLIP